MTNILLFASTVLIWGTTWIAITMQVGPVPVLVSVFYRFATAGIIMLVALALMGKLKRPAFKHQPFIVAQAFCLFSCNFICFYNASIYVHSGLVSVIFSLATIYNAINARIFFGERVKPRTFVAGAIGVAGLLLLFGPDILGKFDANSWKGLGLAALGTLFFSLGNMVSRRNSAAGISPVTANAWGMGYGALFLLVLIAITGTPIVAPPDARYIGAMLYLAVFGSVIGFTTYLMAVSRIGSAKAAYMTVLFPVVALTLSTLFEGYQWTPLAMIGLTLTLLGNLVMFAPSLRRGSAAALPVAKA
jgi:drug/metabolite transporter (DMT)-like permease